MNNLNSTNGPEDADKPSNETQSHIPTTHLRYLKQLKGHFGIKNPIYCVTRKYDGKEFSFDFHDPDSKQLVKIFTEIDPVEMTDYASIPVSEEIILLIDTERLPQEEFADANKFDGLPPMALVAAIQVGACLFHNGLIVKFTGHVDGDRIYDPNEYRARQLNLPIDE